MKIEVRGGSDYLHINQSCAIIWDNSKLATVKDSSHIRHLSTHKQTERGREMKLIGKAISGRFHKCFYQAGLPKMAVFGGSSN